MNIYNLQLFFLDSQDCVHWGLLPVVTESMRHNSSFVKGRFTGDPSYEYEHTQTKRVENQDGDRVEGAEEENIVSITLEPNLLNWVHAQLMFLFFFFHINFFWNSNY